MKLQAIISDASEEKLISYKASLELSGKKITMSEAVDSFIQNAKIEA